MSDKQLLLDSLRQSRDAFLSALDGVREAEAVWKPEPGRWSMLECAEHVAIAEAATVPALPSRPHWALTLLLGTLLACLISPGVAFVVDYFDPSLRTPDELRDVLQIPVLAALPKEEGQRYVS